MAKPTFVAVTEPAAGWTSHAQNATLTTPSFNVTAGDALVVAAGGEDGNVGLGTPSGGGLTWTLQQNVGTSGASSRAAAWTATASATTAITVAITSTTIGAANWGFLVFQFSGSAGIGNSAATSAGSGAPSQALTTTQANSAIVCVSVDWAAVVGTTRTWRTINSITPTAGNTLEKKYQNVTGAYTAYVAYWDDAGAAAAQTAGLTAPTGQTYNIVAVEVKGSAAAGIASKKVIIEKQALVRAAYW